MFGEDKTKDIGGLKTSDVWRWGRQKILVNRAESQAAGVCTLHALLARLNASKFIISHQNIYHQA